MHRPNLVDASQQFLDFVFVWDLLKLALNSPGYRVFL